MRKLKISRCILIAGLWVAVLGGFASRDARAVPNIRLEKETNGVNADTAPGPALTPGSTVTWTYIVTNIGSVLLTDVSVTDDQIGDIDCPQTSLLQGESMVCTAMGAVDPLITQYRNVGTATGSAPDGSQISDTDPSHYTVAVASLEIEKATNGIDADTAPGPLLAPGASVAWTYVVTNTGEVPLIEVVVTDDQGVAVSCPRDSLEPGESMVCSANGTADPSISEYMNVGTATGIAPDGAQVSDTDPSHYTLMVPSVDIEKATNGLDADSAPGPTLQPGDPVNWTYAVTNTGGIALDDVTVTDDQGVAVSCPQNALAPGESMTCTAAGIVVAGQYRNVGTVDAVARQGGAQVTDSDPSHYFAEQPAGGEEGCSLGYWKNHTDSWPPTGFSPGQSVQSVFGAASAFPNIGSATLSDALRFRRGRGVRGGAKLLLKQAVASLLNATHPDVGFPRSASQVISDVNAALASSDRKTMISLKNELNEENNLGCPLN